MAFGPWLFGARTDLLAFTGSAAFALLFVALARQLGVHAETPEWAWVALVLCLDVAHVYSTLFRTYFDAEEVSAHRFRYYGLPALVYAASVALYASGSLNFWRVLAYLAVFHFVRQQVGWVAVYRARAGRSTTFDVALDNAAIYSASLYPLLAWHARLGETRFSWFVKGDFFDVSTLVRPLLPAARAIWLSALLVFFVRQAQRAWQSGRLELGKSLVVGSTALVWYVGIVATNSDFEFTVTNVIAHGVPYIVLLWAYARERRREAPRSVGALLMGGGVLAFLGVLVAFAFGEELLWDRLVWKERAWLFGDSELELGTLALTFLVPLLALPQSVHYVLDGLLWRRGDTRRLAAQRRALGFEH